MTPRSRRIPPTELKKYSGDKKSNGLGPVFKGGFASSRAHDSEKNWVGINGGYAAAILNL